MPFKLERYGDKAIVMNTKTGKHYSTDPIPLSSARSQMAILQNNTKHMSHLRSKRSPRETSEDPTEPEPKRWIQEVVSSPSFKKGAFTAQAKRAGKTTKQMMSDVLANPEEYDVRTRRRAQFMKNVGN